jgi:hypothetical protein
LSSLAALAGCTGSANPGSEETNTSSPTSEKTRTSSPETTETEESSTDEQATQTETSVPETSEAAIRGFLEASTQTDDPTVIGGYFHPLHPLHPDNVDPDAVKNRYPRDTEISTIDIESVDQEVTADMVLSAPILRTTDLEETEVTEALTYGESALHKVQITQSGDDTREYHVITVKTTDQWTILARGVNTKLSDPLEVFVVDDVTFDSEEERARVQFISSPKADSVEVTAKESSSTSRTDNPASESYLDVAIDPEGDEIVVTATLDGRSRTIHREQYPKSARAVDEVMFDADPEGELFDAVGTVTFTGNQQGEKLVIKSTIESSNTTFDTVENVSEGSVPINPDGDELTVSVMNDGRSTKVHRERYYPG